MTTIYCPTCRDQRPVEQPPCVDGHVDCPEWICLDCDTVIVAGWSVTDAPRRVRRLVHAA
ncbi:MAG TPA: hypothetical protein VHW92_05195 [Mycobacteriales bacterium]|jgi:hypothetical protein|nr:hypothetical protein [Mycobacteriales bacterium]